MVMINAGPKQYIWTVTVSLKRVEQMNLKTLCIWIFYFSFYFPYLLLFSTSFLFHSSFAWSFYFIYALTFAFHY